MDETARRMAARRELWQRAFRNIALEGKAVLDAGTGEGHFTRFLAERRPARLVSMTCLEREVPGAKERLGDLAAGVDFHVGDLTHMPEIASESFDVVGGDFLIAAVASYTPYLEIECLHELRRVLRPGGRIVLTGWEVWPETRNRTEAALRSLFKLREAIYHLLGEDPFREHPRFWIERRLADLEMPVEDIVAVPDLHRDFRWFFASVERALTAMEAGALRDALTEKYRDLSQRLGAESVGEEGFEFGRLYAAIACKLSGGVLVGAH